MLTSKRRILDAVANKRERIPDLLPTYIVKDKRLYRSENNGLELTHAYSALMQTTNKPHSTFIHGPVLKTLSSGANLEGAPLQ